MYHYISVDKPSGNIPTCFDGDKLSYYVGRFQECKLKVGTTSRRNCHVKVYTDNMYIGTWNLTIANPYVRIMEVQATKNKIFFFEDDRIVAEFRDIETGAITIVEVTIKISNTNAYTIEQRLSKQDNISQFLQNEIFGEQYDRNMEGYYELLPI